jgi:nucleotide-binding universal stress UspA family protein
MKKILLAFDGSHFSEGALNFARKLNEKSPVLLTGAFLPQVDYANLWSYSGGGSSGASFIPLVEDSDAEAVKKNIKRFESFCHTNHIRCRTHKDYFNFAIPELKKESRYADLLIISSELFYEQAGSERPNDYLKETLHDVECPVIVVPENFEFPQSNILTYDGSKSSVYAIKQFAYLFPELVTQPSILIYAEERSGENIPDEANIKELVTRHFANITFNLGATPKKYFTPWLSERKAPILISGSFGRSGLSRLFRKSFITDVISEHRLPVFIAHK